MPAPMSCSGWRRRICSRAFPSAAPNTKPASPGWPRARKPSARRALNRTGRRSGQRFPEDVRDFTESVTFEERVGATVVFTALEEDPLHAAVAGFAFDFRHHPRTQPGRSLRRLDREVGQRREACATADTPLDDRGADQRDVGRERRQQTGFITQVAQIVDEAAFKIAAPGDAVVAKAALDFAVAYVSGISADRAGEETGSRFGGGGAAIPKEISARISGPRSLGASIALSLVLLTIGRAHV